MTEKQLYFYQALQEFLKCYASEFIGNEVELDNEVILKYMNSDRFWGENFDFSTYEDILKSLEDQVLNGYPIWRMFKLTEWKYNILEKQFSETINDEKSKYKCYSCKYFEETNTSFGVICDCNFKIDTLTQLRAEILKRREAFKVKKTCKRYEKKESDK